MMTVKWRFWHCRDNGFSPGKLQVLDGLTGNIDWEYPSSPDHPAFDPRSLAPSVFDLDRDGNKEIILFDSDRTVHVLSGMDGSFIDTFDLGLESTSVNAIPIFADIDQDGASELILTANPAFGFGPGLIRVYESPNDDWLPTRSIFNQWNYHVTNINADGTVPQYEQPFWVIARVESESPQWAIARGTY